MADGSAGDARAFFNLADEVSDKSQIDVMFYAGTIGVDADRLVRDCVRSNKRHDSVLLLLTTLGGDADAGYKLMAFLQRQYKSVDLFVHTYCKSAGTLIAAGATSLIMSDSAELGPLDVQLRKPDEIDERTSGLTPLHALSSLKNNAYNTFETFFVKLRSRTRISSKIAAEVAANLTTGLFAPIYQQMEPMRLGENDRSVQVAEEYAKRLGKIGKNLKSEALSHLIAAYPSHSFVIDRDEARRYFHRVREPSEIEGELGLSLEDFAYFQLTDDPENPEGREPVVLFLSGVLTNDQDESGSGASRDSNEPDSNEPDSTDPSTEDRLDSASVQSSSGANATQG